LWHIVIAIPMRNEPLIFGAEDNKIYNCSKITLKIRDS